MHCRTMAATASLSCERRLDSSSTYSCSCFQSRASCNSCAGEEEEDENVEKTAVRVLFV